MIMRSSRAMDDCHWALSTSTVARDVSNFANLHIGVRLTGQLDALTWARDTLTLPTIFLSRSDDEPVTDLFTARRLLP